MKNCNPAFEPGPDRWTQTTFASELTSSGSMTTFNTAPT